MSLSVKSAVSSRGVLDTRPASRKTSTTNLLITDRSHTPVCRWRSQLKLHCVI